MDKVLLGIHAPTIQEVYDAFVPIDVPIRELIPIIADGLTEISDGKYGVSRLEMVSLKDPESLLDPKMTLREYNIKDGMQLYFL